MDTVEASWHSYVAVIAWLREAVLPVVDVNVLDFVNALLAVVAIRATVRHPLHWQRSLITTFITSTAGGTMLLLSLGRSPRWLLCSDAWHAIALAWYLGFMAPWPLSMIISTLESPRLAPVRSVLRAMCMAFFMSAFGIENVVRALREHPEWSGDNGRPSRAHVGAFMTAGIACSCGGGVFAEYLNVLQLPLALYQHPTPLGPGQDFTIGFVLSALYIFILRDILPPGSGTFASEYYPLPRDRDTAMAVLVLVAVWLHLIPAPAWRAAVASFTDKIPGWRNTFIPASLTGTPDFCAGYAGGASAYGYELPAAADAVTISEHKAAGSIPVKAGTADPVHAKQQALRERAVDPVVRSERQ